MFSTVLRSAPDALDAVLDALDWPLRPQSALFLFGACGEPLVCVHVDRTTDCLDGFVDSIVPLLRQTPEVHSLVAGSVVAFGPTPAADLQLAFLDGRDRLDALGIELVDWFVIDPVAKGDLVRAVSLAEASDARRCWRASRQE
jgi:hypothetical protein